MKHKLLEKLQKMPDKEFWKWVKTWNKDIKDKDIIISIVGGWHEVITEMELNKLENG